MLYIDVYMCSPSETKLLLLLFLLLPLLKSLFYLIRCDSRRVTVCFRLHLQWRDEAAFGQSYRNHQHCQSSADTVRTGFMQ